MSRHNFAKRDVVVMHFLSLQHLFSTACAMGLQRPHVHQSTRGALGDGSGSAVPVGVSAVSTTGGVTRYWYLKLLRRVPDLDRSLQDHPP